MDLDMDPDPWNWSVDDVVSFFQHKAASYITDMPHSRLPPLDSFLPALKANDIDGAILLAEVETNMLKNDCGISSAGVRSIVLRCIKKLRQESIRYISDHSSQSLQVSTLPISIPTTSAQPLSRIFAPQVVPPSSETLPESPRPGEVQFQDVQGKKRRRLNISSFAPVQEKYTQSGEFVPIADSIKAANLGYFGTSACPIDELFYGKTEFGQEVECMYPKGEIMIENTDRAAGRSHKNFHFTNHNKPIGEKQYVYKLMRHFFTNDDTIELQRKERNAVALVPYRIGLQSSRSATVIQFEPGKHEPVAIKENLEHLTSGHMPEEYLQQSAGEWDFLVQKHKSSEDQLLPVYGESDDDDGDDSLETPEGDLLDAAEEEVDDHVFHKDHVVEIIEASVRAHIAKWQDSVEKLEEKKAWTVWKKTKGSRTLRASLTQTAQGRIEHLTGRLNNIKKEIMIDEYRTEQAVQDACVSLEVTIEDREEQLWMIDVWKRRQEPAHTIRHGTHNTHQGLPTPLTTGKGERPLHIHPNDRFSVSPLPDGGADADVEMQDVSGSVDDAETDGEARYEADIETEDEILYDAPTDEPRSSANGSGSEYDVPGFVVSTDEVEPNEDGLSGHELNTDTETMPDDPLHDDNDKSSNFSPEEDVLESEQLASPSTFVKPMKSSPRPKSQPPARYGVIDLTGMTSDSSTTRKKIKPTDWAVLYGGQPQEATAAKVDAWDMPTLISKNDRQRIMIKLLRNVGVKNLQRLHSYYLANRINFTTHLLTACHFAKESGSAGIGLIDDDVEAISLAGSICVSWLFPAKSADEIRNMGNAEFGGTVDTPQLALFTGMFAGLLTKRNSSLFNTPPQTPSKKKMKSSSDPIEISSDASGPTQSRTPHRQRKRAVKMSKSAMNSRVTAHQRQEKFAESQTANSSQLAGMIPHGPSSSNIEINPVRDEGADPVYVHRDIGKKMKAHQIEGVQFLWREITADDDDGAQGCVLAHTMGLGKTMQTIALLVAVNQAARSKNKTTYRQLPSHLRLKGHDKRMLRVLILCPATLIENWQREINQWAEGMLGRIYGLDSNSKTVQINNLEDWMHFGGVALAGYEKFSRMVLQKPRANQKTDHKNILSDQQQARMKQMLIEGPDIVVADEAHKLKDKDTDNAKSAAEIKTYSRIALTGTPMSNNVDEIYALISWVAPGYLGDPVEFKAHYAEPIAAGTDKDSTSAERRKGTIKLTVLHKEIQPKINRANIEVLKGSLKPKVEFVITVPLGEQQTELYTRYIRALLSGDQNSKAGEFRMFGWLSDLQLLTNHPECFRKKLLTPPKPRTAKPTDHDEDMEDVSSRDRTPLAMESGSTTPMSEVTNTTADQGGEGYGDQPAGKLGLTPEMIIEILKGFEEDLDPQLSTKMAIFLPLLKYSIDCNDKVILFSSSIPTLNYLAELLDQQNLKFGRIDGKKNMKQKMEALEEFHDDYFDVMLVSTKAGGVGLNIQGANRVFIFDFSFNPTWEEQAIGRAYRIGQTKPVYVYRFVAGGTFETNIYNKQLFKSSLAKRVVDKKNPQRNATRNTADYLYEPRVVEQKDLSEEIGKDAKVLDRLLSQHGPGEEGKIDTMIRAITTWETLQVEHLDEELNEEEKMEVEKEIQQNLVRPKGKRAPGATQLPHPSSGLMVKMPMPTQPNPRHRAGASGMPPPPSTFAGPSNYPQPGNHPLGGLPMPRGHQPYQE